eukprot:5263284-Amphidinium_carterae.2
MMNPSYNNAIRKDMSWKAKLRATSQDLNHQRTSNLAPSCVACSRHVHDSRPSTLLNHPW